MKRTWKNLVFSVYWAAYTRIDRFFSTLRSRMSLRWQGAVVGKGLYTSGPCFFKLRREGSIRIGTRVSFVADTRSNRAGLTNPVVLETWGDGEIEIGDFSGGSAVVISSRSRVTIGNRVLLGANVRIFDNDFHSLDFSVRRNPEEDRRHIRSAPVTLGDGVFVGANAMILKGVSIGDRAVVAAGSVVTKSIPADEVWGGNPARLLRGL